MRFGDAGLLHTEVTALSPQRYAPSTPPPPPLLDLTLVHGNICLAPRSAESECCGRQMHRRSPQTSKPHRVFPTTPPPTGPPWMPTQGAIQGCIRTADNRRRSPPPPPDPPPPPLPEAKTFSVPLVQEDLPLKKLSAAFSAAVGGSIGRGGVRPNPPPPPHFQYLPGAILVPFHGRTSTRPCRFALSDRIGHRRKARPPRVQPHLRHDPAVAGPLGCPEPPAACPRPRPLCHPRPRGRAGLPRRAPPAAAGRPGARARDCSLGAAGRRGAVAAGARRREGRAGGRGRGAGGQVDGGVHGWRDLSADQLGLLARQKGGKPRPGAWTGGGRCGVCLEGPNSPCITTEPAGPKREGGGQGCITRERASEEAPEAVGQAVGGGCQSGWGRLLSVTNIPPCHRPMYIATTLSAVGEEGGGGWRWAPTGPPCTDAQCQQRRRHSLRRAIR